MSAVEHGIERWMKQIYEKTVYCYVARRNVYVSVLSDFVGKHESALTFAVIDKKRYSAEETKIIIEAKIIFIRSKCRQYQI